MTSQKVAFDQVVPADAAVSADPDDPAVSAADVAENRSTACWTVEERAWKQVLPELPDEVIALLATPVVVTAEPYARAGEEADDETPQPSVPSPLEPCADGAGYGTRTPRFLAPAPPRRSSANQGAHGGYRGTRTRARIA